jgi:methylated-DNA-[protein]-cysteine S-methyltransferase
MEDLFYTLRPTPFGTLAIVWMKAGGREKVCRVFLPHEGIAVEKLVLKAFPRSKKLTSDLIKELAARIDGFLGGEPVVFPLDTIRLDQCPPFQRKVLLAEHRIPRGWVSTYGRIARHIGVPGGARAVGGALSRNPFPILIPCHRAVRSDGELGGFQGGPKTKRTLLELEGIRFSSTGKLLCQNLFY